MSDRSTPAAPPVECGCGLAAADFALAHGDEWCGTECFWRHRPQPMRLDTADAQCTCSTDAMNMCPACRPVTASAQPGIVEYEREDRIINTVARLESCPDGISYVDLQRLREFIRGELSVPTKIVKVAEDAHSVTYAVRRSVR